MSDIAQEERKLIIAKGSTKAKVCARITPPLAGITVYFELDDPDDKSPYEQDEISFDNSLPCTYEELQQKMLQYSSNVKFAVAKTNSDGIATATLSVLPCSGDNYRVRATCCKPGPGFDGWSGLEKSGCNVSTIATSRTLIAWKRKYIEWDLMYQTGATITENSNIKGDDSDVTRDSDNNVVLTVDDASDFKNCTEGTKAWIFFADKNLPEEEVFIQKVENNKISYESKKGSLKIPKFTGIRLENECCVYVANPNLLTTAFGDGQNNFAGTDGGAFIEFVQSPAPGGISNAAPKYARFPNSDTSRAYASAWFEKGDKIDAKTQAVVKGDPDYVQVVAAYQLEPDPEDPRVTFLGWALSNKRMIMVANHYLHPDCDNIDGNGDDLSTEESGNALVHEMGHVLGDLGKSANGHVDLLVAAPDFNFSGQTKAWGGITSFTRIGDTAFTVPNKDYAKPFIIGLPIRYKGIGNDYHYGRVSSISHTNNYSPWTIVIYGNQPMDTSHATTLEYDADYSNCVMSYAHNPGVRVDFCKECIKKIRRNQWYIPTSF